MDNFPPSPQARSVEATPFWHSGAGGLGGGGGYTRLDRVLVLPEDPDSQVAMTINVMREYAGEDSGCDVIRQQAADALREVGANPQDYDDAQAVQAVWNYVKSRLTFCDDSKTGQPVEEAFGIPVIESVTRPRDIESWGVGDCDDFSTWGAALLGSMGINSAFATVAADSRVPGEYSHVYLVAYPDDCTGSGQQVRVPMDLSHGKEIGWETPNRFGKFKEWPVTTAGTQRSVFA